ncbi:MAG: tautomerase family protein [Burkholderiales bacterium]
MPYVNVRLVGTLTREQKRKIAEKITEIPECIARKAKSYRHFRRAGGRKLGNEWKAHRRMTI